MGFLHSDRRNRLAQSVLNKLMFVRTNNGGVEETDQEGSEEEDCDI